MTNVLSLAERRQRRATSPGPERLLMLFAQERHRPEDVRWLKENAELLRLLVACGRRPATACLAEAYGGFVAGLTGRLQFFPQYYRFFLSIALDLQALGLPDVGAEALVDWALAQRLAGAELSDLQRAEARLMAERLPQAPAADPGLTARLLAFAEQAETFALPNRKAAYELTHIAFYLSDYGTRAFEAPARMLDSLHNAGMIAHLEGNLDLLAEICLALRHCGAVPPADWQARVAQGFEGFALSPDPAAEAADDYHAWLMAAWALEAGGQPVLDQPLPSERFGFLPPAGSSTLLEVSAALLDLGAGRSGEWPAMRERLAPRLAGRALAHLDRLAASTPRFEAFFARFARVPQPIGQPALRGRG